MGMGTSPPPILQVPGARSPVVKQPGHEADHSPQPCVEVKNEWSCTSTPPVSSRHAQQQLYLHLYSPEGSNMTKGYKWHIFLEQAPIL